MNTQQNDQSLEGGTLKALREKLGGISQEELARRLGCSNTSVSRWERGAVEPSLTIPQVKQFVKLLMTAGIPIDAIPDDLSKPLIRDRLSSGVE